MRKLATLLWTLLVISACGTERVRVDPSRALLERGAARLGPSGDDLVLLGYTARGHDGEWLHEVLTGEGLHVERRTHTASGARWAAGLDRYGAWIRVGDRAPHALDDKWSAELRARERAITRSVLSLAARWTSAIGGRFSRDALGSLRQRSRRRESRA